MAQANPTRSRLLRAGLLSASVLGFIPVLTLVRQTGAADTTHAAPTPQPLAAQLTRSLPDDVVPTRPAPNGSRSFAAPASSTPSPEARSSPTPAAPPAQTRRAPHSRTRAS